MPANQPHFYFDNQMFVLNNNGTIGLEPKSALRELAWFGVDELADEQVRETYRYIKQIISEQDKLSGGRTGLQIQQGFAADYYEHYKPWIVCAGAIAAVCEEAKATVPDDAGDVKKARQLIDVFKSKSLAGIMQANSVEDYAKMLVTTEQSLVPGHCLKPVARAILHYIGVHAFTKPSKAHPLDDKVHAAITAEAKRWLEEMGLPGIEPQPQNRFGLTDVDRKTIADTVASNWRDLSVKFTARIPPPIVEHFKPKGDDRSRKVHQFTPENEQLKKDFWALYQQAPAAVKPLLALSFGDERLRVMFFDPPLMNSNSDYRPHVYQAIYQPQAHRAFLPRRIDAASMFSHLPSLFASAKLQIERLDNLQSREHCWTEEMVHAALNRLFVNNGLPYDKGNPQAAELLRRALMKDAELALATMDTNAYGQFAYIMRKTLEGPVRYDPAVFAPGCMEVTDGTAQIIAREISAKLFMHLALGEEEAAKELAPNTLALIREPILKAATQACQKVKLDPERLGPVGSRIGR